MSTVVPWAEKIDPDRTRTCTSLIRSQMPYPLGHRTFSDPYIFEWVIFHKEYSNLYLKVILYYIDIKLH